MIDQLSCPGTLLLFIQFLLSFFRSYHLGRLYGNQNFVILKGFPFEYIFNFLPSSSFALFFNMLVVMFRFGVYMDFHFVFALTLMADIDYVVQV